VIGGRAKATGGCAKVTGGPLVWTGGCAKATGGSLVWTGGCAKATGGSRVWTGGCAGYSGLLLSAVLRDPNYVDDNFLATEIDYAIEEKRKKGDRFAIITLVFEHEKRKGAVPELLRRYVWREPANDLEGLREIIKALSVMVGPVRWGR
jgi:hypothetical protein